MIKVIGGLYRSRNLEVPDTLTVPTKSRVREAIASSLLSSLENAVVADIFAGSGAMGIEFLSRGAKKAYFI
ncbi:MAG: RsmD family RNA methyltransferase, partial [Bacillales bacterium]|nr:RsmD family RNA methyltransferase [Bacillales bacterium]MDY5919608.1 RsmD family RNA methyltransferase [Candidatus Enteromonas sp.]